MRPAKVALAVLALAALCAAIQPQPPYPGRKPYIPQPADYDYCQAAYNTDGEVSRIQSRMGQGRTLRMVQMLTRHGDRTPIAYLNSPNYNDTVVWECNVTKLTHFDVNGLYHTQNRLYVERYMPGREAYSNNCVMGALTSKGVNQHVQNGEKFRRMYVDTAKLLPTSWNSDDLYVRAGDELRLIESAQAILAGLYPLVNNNHVEQRLPVDLIQSSFDNMTPDIEDVCPTLQKMEDLYDETPAWQNYLPQHNEMQDELDDIFGTYVTTWGTADIIRCRYCHGYDYTFDGLLSNSLIEELLVQDQFAFTFFPNDTASNRLGMGSFLGELMVKFQARVDGQVAGNPRFSIYSGHDSSIWPFLDTLNLYDGMWPPLASNVVMELWQDNANAKQFYMEVIYNGRSITSFLPDCGGSDQCTWEQFKHSTRFVNIGLDEFWKECADVDKIPPPPSKTPHHHKRRFVEPRRSRL